jgi:hypothetical protein
VVLVPASDEIEIPLPVVVMLLLVMEIPELPLTEIEPHVFWLITGLMLFVTEIVLFADRVLLLTVAVTGAVERPVTEIP